MVFIQSISLSIYESNKNMIIEPNYYADDDRDRLLSSRMAGDCWKMTWSDGSVVTSDGRKKGCQMRLDSTPIYRQNGLYGITKWKVYGVTSGYGVTEVGNSLINNLGLVKLDSHGILFLVSSGGTVIWSSNTSASSPNVKPTAQLLDSGNLVIKTENNVLWQSFDYPGDTFIPGMKMGKNFITGKETYVTSWRSVDDPFPGEYTPGLAGSKRRSRALDCGPGEGFLKLASMKFPDTQNAVFDGSMILQECEVACKDNCSCTAYANPNISRGGVGCLQWFGELIDVQGTWSPNLALAKEMCTHHAPLPNLNLGIKMSPRVTVPDAQKENRVGLAATAVYIYPMVPTYLDDNSVNNSDI
ncbi:G-type lectin S-receptor-like serine/threonine-protein kinase [Tanacetum coccineum]|uniref:G-type lectin S-receptor-like serine/threonine-protein kinase n=1 Tax=Tanacetum coccineum TaxID=301880 RepID=A0ABQ5GDC1_9ASTR